MKPAIAVDVDDVLAAHVEAFVHFSNTRYGTQLTIDEYVDRWADVWHVDHEEVERRAAEFHQPEIIGNLRFIEESRSVIEELRKDYTLYVVTARRKKHVELTREYIERHLPGMFKDIHFVPIWEVGSTRTKLDICREIGATYLIDDLPKHCEIAASGGLQPILFGDYGWNRDHQISPTIVRCLDWSAVGEYFKALEK